MYTTVWINQDVHRDATTPWCVFRLILVCMKVLFDKKAWECLHDKKKNYTFASLLERKTLRAFSSAGSEHLPYKQRVGGSNPSTPTKLDVSLSFKKGV